MTQQDMLAAIDQEKQTWQNIVNQVGSDRMETPGVVGNWTFKDFAAHMTGWREHTIRHLDAAAHGTEPVLPWPPELQEVDQINDWMYQQNRNRPADEVLQESEASFGRLSEVVQLFSEDELNDSERIGWLKGTSLAGIFNSGDMFGHYHEEHAEEVQAFLSQDT